MTYTNIIIIIIIILWILTHCIERAVNKIILLFVIYWESD